MKNSLPNNIPTDKKEELEDIVRIIKKQTKPEFIILFGSYARGSFVEYDETQIGHITESYESDFDILVVVANEAKENNKQMWAEIENRISRKVYTGIDLMVENIHFVNEMLSDGVPVFVDIRNDGVVLFKRDRANLAKPRKLTAEERVTKAQEDFDYFMKKARNCFIGFNTYSKENILDKAAFELHQVTENLFIAIQMVFVRYAPKQHDLKKLEKIVAHFGYDPFEIFPRNSKEEKHYFDLLRSSYVDARYRKSFKITEDEVQTLFERVKKVEERIVALSEGKIEMLEGKCE